MSQPLPAEYIPSPWKRPDAIEYDRPLIAKAKAGNVVAQKTLMRKYGLRVFTEEELLSMEAER